MARNDLVVISMFCRKAPGHFHRPAHYRFATAPWIELLFSAETKSVRPPKKSSPNCYSVLASEANADSLARANEWIVRGHKF